MNDDWVESLLDLQKIDIELEKLSSAIKNNPQKKQLLNERLLGAQSVFDEKSEEKRQKEKEIEDLQHQVQKKEANILNLKTKMGMIKDNKSYRTMLLEIENTKEAISELETQELQLMEIVDKKQLLVNEAKDVLDKQQSIVDEQISRFDEELTRLEIEKVDKEKQYEEFESLVDEDIYAKYKGIRDSLGGRKGAILVAVDDEKCGGCFLQLTAQQVINAKKKKPKTTCNNCGTLIYQ